MRRIVLCLLTSVVVFGFCHLSVFAQTESDAKSLILKWSKGQQIQTGLISLKTFEKLKETDDVEDSAIISFLDLDGKSNDALAVQESCAAVGNCEFELFKKSGETYQKLLSAEMVQTIKVLKTKTNGYFDLELKTHNSAYDSYHRIYAFDGKSYRRKKCRFETYQILDAKGNAVELQNPKITNGCGEEY